MKHLSKYSIQVLLFASIGGAMKKFGYKAGVAGLAAIALLFSANSALAVDGDSGPPDGSGESVGEIPTVIPGGLTYDEYVNLPVEEQLALKQGMDEGASDEARQFQDENPAPEFIADMAKFSDQLTGLVESHPDSFASYSVDIPTTSISIGYNKNADRASIEDLLLTVERILAPYTYPVEFVAKDHSYAHLLAVADEIASGWETWSPRFGGKSYSTSPNSDGNGLLSIGTEGVPDPSWTDFTYKGVKVEVVSTGAPAINFHSRIADVSPHYSGSKMTSGPSDPYTRCTNGFVWTKWSGGGIWGSTAEHCYQLYGYSQFYNNGVLFGIRSVYNNKLYDTMLLHPRLGETFAPWVYIGGATTSTAWPVVGAYSVPVGGAVALHAASGYTSWTTVAATDQSVSYSTTYQVTGISWTWSYENENCQEGDSGGPWVSSVGTSLFAHGQHLGGYRPSGYKNFYCSFIDINKISTALQATLVTV